MSLTVIVVTVKSKVKQDILPSKDGFLSKLSLTIRSESRAGGLGEEGPRTPEHLFRHELDSLSRPWSLTTSLFSPVEWQHNQQE